jgi:GT2 family glycosyltransferase
MLASEQFGLQLRVIDQPQSGVATTRNRGAAEARAPLLIFLDDDVRATGDLVQAHASIQAEGPCVSIGHLSADDEGQPPGWWRWMEWQLEKQYAEMVAGSRRVDGLALYSGNFALPRELFQGVGGFDTSMKTCEDTDLGIRLQNAGAAFRLNLAAIGLHSGYHDYRSWQNIACRDGSWDAERALRLAYPFGWHDLLRGFHERHVLVRRFARLLLDRKRLFWGSIAGLRAIAATAGLLRLRALERYVYGGIYALIYWQAVSDGVGGASLLWRYLRRSQTLEVAA